MSNLNLPTMTYRALDELLGDNWRKQIAYATHAERVGNSIYVKHHSSVIAVLEHDCVYITNAGYESSTTTNRLQQILRANHIPFAVRIQQYRNVIEEWRDGKRVARGPFSQATFTRAMGEWSIA